MGATQEPPERNARNLRTSSAALPEGPLGGPKRDHRFTEPGALSSTAPVDFPPSALRLPRTASGDDFNLLASRARCKHNTRPCRSGMQGVSNWKRAQFANFSFFSSCTAFCARCYESGELVSGPPADARRGTKGSPSRVRFRPPPPLTFRPQPCGFRVRPPVTTSTYSRPVLGARRTLRIGQGRCKGARKGKDPQIAPRFPHSSKTPGDKPVDWARGASRPST